MTTATARRLPRFQRVSDGVSPLELTSRDQEIIRQIARHRFLRSTHITALVSGSRQQILRRLQRLYHLGFLERPRCQIDYYHRHGSKSMVYGLGKRAAGLLTAESLRKLHHFDWTEKNRYIGRYFLEHALLVSDLMVSFEIACRSRTGIRFLTASELALPEATQKHREPFKWSVALPDRRKLGVIPDAIFALETAHKDGAARRAYFFLEADRATMPVSRQNLSRSSFFRKFLAYEATWTQGIHRSRFGFHRFRVLTVTSSKERTQHLADTCRELRSGQGLFLFTDVGAVKESGDPLSVVWNTANQTCTTTLLG